MNMTSVARYSCIYLFNSLILYVLVQYIFCYINKFGT